MAMLSNVEQTCSAGDDNVLLKVGSSNEQVGTEDDCVCLGELHQPIAFVNLCQSDDESDSIESSGSEVTKPANAEPEDVINLLHSREESERMKRNLRVNSVPATKTSLEPTEPIPKLTIVRENSQRWSIVTPSVTTNATEVPPVDDVQDVDDLAAPEDIDLLICDQCYSIFQTEELLAAHVTSEHPMSEIQCKRCHAMFQNALSWQRHVQTEHPRQRTTYLCPRCDYKTSFLVELRSHIDTNHRHPDTNVRIPIANWRNTQVVEKSRKFQKPPAQELRNSSAQFLSAEVIFTPNEAARASQLETESVPVLAAQKRHNSSDQSLSFPTIQAKRYCKSAMKFLSSTIRQPLI